MLNYECTDIKPSKLITINRNDIIHNEHVSRLSIYIIFQTNSVADYNRHQCRSQLDVKIRQLQIMSGVYGLARHAASVVSTD